MVVARNVAKRKELSALDRVAKSLKAVTQQADTEGVHFFRTSCRRLAVYADLTGGEAGRALRKLARKLGKARRLAGRVRDLDVQSALLRGLEIEGDREERRRLLVEMEQAHARATRKLNKELDEEKVAELRDRIAKARRTGGGAAMPAARYRERAWERAVELASALPEDFSTIGTKNLHDLRLACKNVRYTAEQALPGARAREMVAAMKRVQDAIGLWHDWAVLRERARELAPAESALSRVLRGHERTARAEALRRAREIVRPHIHTDAAPALPASAKRAEPATASSSNAASAS
jgi:CHAD domain-containing protein